MRFHVTFSGDPEISETLQTSPLRAGLDKAGHGVFQITPVATPAAAAAEPTTNLRLSIHSSQESALRLELSLASVCFVTVT